MKILQGDIYQVDLGDPSGSGPGYPHPFVVISHDSFNASAIDTVVTCQLTGTLRMAKHRGNVLLVPGEGDLREQSVVNVSQVWTFDKDELGRLIGRLDPARMRQIIEGMNLMMTGVKIGS